MKAAEEFLTKLIRDVKKRESVIRSARNWASAAYGLATHCDDVVRWLRRAHAWSPGQEIADRVEARALQKEVQRSAELSEQLCVAQGRRLKTAEHASDLRAENGALKLRCRRAQSEAKDQQAA